MNEALERRLSLCESNINETFDNIKSLQSRHQQLIGYKQALMDVISDFESAEEKKQIQEALESANPEKKKRSVA